MNDAEINLDDDEIDNELIDQDYSDYYENVNNQIAHDKEILEGGQ